MADIAVAPAPAAVTPKTPKAKTPKAKKATTPAAHHPTYSSMISAAIASLHEKSGSSRQAIVKYMVATYKISEKTASSHVKQALKRGVAGGELKQIKGAGASGSFKLNVEVKTPSKKTPKKATTPKKSPKKHAAKKIPLKTASKAKKRPAKKSKKSPAAKKSVAKASKPKKPAAKKLRAKK